MLIKMKTDGTSRILSKTASQEQQENTKNCRRTLKVLQEAAYDKENLAGRSRIGSSVKLAKDDEKTDIKPKIVVHKAVQTGEAVITEEDLTSDEPTADYWRLLAEQRGKSLDESLQEIEHLKEQVDSLGEENRICKEMLDESRNLVEVLQEMVEEGNSVLEEGNSVLEEAGLVLSTE